MITISATEFQSHFSEYLNRVARGETLQIEKIAQVIPSQSWRNNMTIQPQLQVPPEQLIEPLEEKLWEEI